MPTSNPQPLKFVLLGIPFYDVTFAETVAWARERIHQRQPAYVATANLDFVMQAWRDPELQRILIEANLVIADGMPLVWISPFFGPRLRERVTGSDLVPLLAEMCCAAGFSIFLLGGAPGVAEQAAAALGDRYPGLKIAGCYAPPMADVVHMNHAEILAKLDAAKPDLLLIAFGAPKQEKWANMHVRQWQVPLAIGVGGTLDFLAGAQVRAPQFLQKIGLEWVWRLATNPKRLFQRYAQNLVFFLSATGRLFALRLGLPRLGVAPPPAFHDLENVARQAHIEHWSGLPDDAAARAWLTQLAAAAGRRVIVLDLSAAAWLSSLELGVLLTLNQMQRAGGTRLFLIRATARVQRLLTVCRLDRYLEIKNSAEELDGTLQQWKAAQLEAIAWGDSAQRIILRLPTELTAANLAAVRERWEKFWRTAGESKELKELAVQVLATTFMDSSALGFLVGVKKTIEQRGLRWCCADAQPAVRQIMRIARLDTVLLTS